MSLTPFTYDRVVFFRDTDAAGVVYFANVLAMCHEAYEASLAAAGINVRAFFRNGEIALPIVHASVDFMRPMHCGDRLAIQLTAQQLNPSTFEIAYHITLDTAPETVLSRAVTRHVCIDGETRKRQDLPGAIAAWLQT